MYIDTHAHLASSSFTDQALEKMMERARAEGVEKIGLIATSIEEYHRGKQLSLFYPEIYLIGAITPHDLLEEELDLSFQFFREKALKKELKAIGETGLDYYNAEAPKELQFAEFIRYMGLAKEAELPLMIHCRSAFADCFSLLDHHYQGSPFLIHCFTGTLQEAYQVLERGGYLSMSGILTFKKSYELQEIIAKIPLDRVVIETDAPFLAPHPFRGSVNEPAFVPYVAKMIAEIKGAPLEEVARVLTHNAKQFFKLI